MSDYLATTLAWSLETPVHSTNRRPHPSHSLLQYCQDISSPLSGLGKSSGLSTLHWYSAVQWLTLKKFLKQIIAFYHIHRAYEKKFQQSNCP